MRPEILLPVIIAAVAFVVYCYVDLIRVPATRWLPKWAWALICLISIPLGGLIYLIFGRGETRESDS